MDPTYVCPNAIWQTLPFMPNPGTPDFNPLTWKEEQWNSYFRSTLVTRAVPNIFFASIPIGLLVFVALWRIVWIFCLCCRQVCKRLWPRKGVSAAEVIHDPWLKAFKVTFAFFAGGCITLAVAGMISLPRPKPVIGDLVSRLETASISAESIFNTSDWQMAAVMKLRPSLDVLDAQMKYGLGLTHSLPRDMQCVPGLLEYFLTEKPDPDLLRAVLSDYHAAIYDSQMLYDSAVGAFAWVEEMKNVIQFAWGTPDGITSTLLTLSNIADGLSDMNTPLNNFVSALQTIDGAPTRSSNTPAHIDALQRALNSLNPDIMLRYVTRLYQMVMRIELTTTAPFFTRTVGYINSTRYSAISALNSSFITYVNKTLAQLDALYLGSGTTGTSPTLYSCLEKVAPPLKIFNDSLFGLTNTSQREEVQLLLSIHNSLNTLYTEDMGPMAIQMGATETHPLTDPIPQPLTPILASANKVLTPMAAFDLSSLASLCADVDRALGAGQAAVNATMRSLGTLVSSLNATQTIYTRVAQRLSLYQNTSSDASYDALRRECQRSSNSPDVVARDMTNMAGAGGDWVKDFQTVLGNALSLANGSAITSILASLSQLTMSFDRKAADPSFTRLNISQPNRAAAMEKLFAATDMLQTYIPSNATSKLDKLEALLTPLQEILSVISSTVTDGLIAAEEQLDNVLGVGMAPPQSPPPQSSPPAASMMTGRQPGVSISFSTLPSHHSRRLSQTNTNGGNDMGGQAPRPPPTTARPPPRPAPQGVPPPTNSTPPSVNITTAGRQYIVRPMNELIASVRKKSVRNAANVGYGVTIWIFVSIVLVCALLALSLFFNFPVGILACVITLLVLTLLIFIVALLSAMGLVVTYDVCANMETIALSALPTKSSLLSLAQFYLQGIGGGFAAVMHSTGLGDASRMKIAVDAVFNKILDPLLLPEPLATSNWNTTITPWPGALGSVQYNLSFVLAQMSYESNILSALVTRFMKVATRWAVLRQYNNVTSWACCRLGGLELVFWVCTTGCGLLGLLSSITALLVLRKLDEMPGGTCCICTRYNPQDYAQPEQDTRAEAKKNGDGKANSKKGDGKASPKKGDGKASSKAGDGKASPKAGAARRGDQVVASPPASPRKPEVKAVLGKPDAVSTPLRNSAVSPPVGDSELPLPIQNSVVSSPVGNPAVLLTVHNSVLPPPVGDSEVSPPKPNSEITPPVLNPVVSLPMRDSAVLPVVLDAGNGQHEEQDRSSTTTLNPLFEDRVPVRETTPPPNVKPQPLEEAAPAVRKSIHTRKSTSEPVLEQDQEPDSGDK